MANAGQINLGPRAKTAEWRNVDLRTFREEIVPADRPAVLKGLVQDWPAVREGRKSPQTLCDYLKSFDAGRMVQTIFVRRASIA